MIAANGGGNYELREFPPERKRIDIGDFLTDDTPFPGACPAGAARRASPTGLRRSLDYYREPSRELLIA